MEISSCSELRGLFNRPLKYINQKCRQVTREADALPLAEKLVQELRRPYLIENKEICSSASIGVTTYPGDIKDPEQPLKNADYAMYAAKSSGRSTYRMYSTDLDQEKAIQWLTSIPYFFFRSTSWT